MKKRLFIKINCFLLLLSMLAVNAGCGINKNGEKTKGDLSVMVYAAGYGMKWVDAAIRVYNEDHPGITVSAEGDSLAFDTIDDQLESGNCAYDIVLVSSNEYEKHVANGNLVDLTDMYDSEIPGSMNTVRGVISPQITQKRTIGGKIYGVPWQINASVGLIYNVTMFENYNWELPETMDELWAFCDNVANDTNGKVAPLTYPGAENFGYMAYTFCQWLCEYYGYDAMMDFLKIESPEAWRRQAEGRSKIYETIAKLTVGVTDNGNTIALEGSKGAYAYTAQTNFLAEKAAMTVCGPWFPTEMEPLTSLTTFKAGYCPMPHINADKKSGDGTIDTSTIRFSTDGNLMAVPSTSENKELAKDFLRYMFTSKSYTSFVKANNGLTRPVQNIEVDTEGFNDFTKEVYGYFHADGKAQNIYQVTPNGLIESGELGIFMAYKGAFFSRITGCANYARALETARSCVAQEVIDVSAFWDSNNMSWKIK